MSLNLGLESLNQHASGRVFAFTPASAVEMSNAAEAITNLMASLENYYDAARNAMLVKKAVRKFGQTQSIVALIGQEGLAAAQSFSMEGFWGKVKEFLIKIWEKIKEWWGRFWGLFFSVESKLSSFVSTLGSSSNKRLQHDCAFDAPTLTQVSTRSTVVTGAISTLKATANASNFDDKKVLDEIYSRIGSFKQDRNMSVASEQGSNSFDTENYVLKTVTEVKAVATKTLKVFTDNKNAKKDIDDYTKKFLDKIKTMKVSASAAGRLNGSNGNAFGDNAQAARAEGSDATDQEKDVATQVIKQAAKLNNAGVSAVLKAATTIAIKLMAHTRLVD